MPTVGHVFISVFRILIIHLLIFLALGFPIVMPQNQINSKRYAPKDPVTGDLLSPRSFMATLPSQSLEGRGSEPGSQRRPTLIEL